VGPDDAAVVRVALLTEEFLRLESAEQAGDVWFGGNHATADGRTGEAGGSGTAEDAEDVVLRGGQAAGFETLVYGALQVIGRAHECEQGLLLGTGEADCLL